MPDIDGMLAEYDPGLGGERLENMEMASGFLIHFLAGLGHCAGTIWPVMAHRRENTFDHQCQDAVEAAARVALLTLARLRAP